MVESENINKEVTESNTTVTNDGDGVVTNSDGSVTSTETLSDGTVVKTTVNKDKSKVIITSKTDGSEYKTEISSDGNTTTTTEVKPPSKKDTVKDNVTNNTDSTNNNKSSEVVEDTRSAVEKIKGVSTYAPNEIIGKNCNIEIDGFQFVADEITLTESYPRRNIVRTNIMGGGQQTSKGEYVPRSFSFNTSINYPTGNPDAYDKLWSYMNNKECKVVCQYTGDMTAEVQIQKTYPKGMGNTVKLSVSLTEISKADNSYTVKTEMGGFTTLTDNSADNIKEMEDVDGNRIKVQTNVSDKHTSDMMQNLKEIEKEDEETSTSTVKYTDKQSTNQADSTKTLINNKTTPTSTSNTTKTINTTKTDVTNNINNTTDYVSRDVNIKL